MAALSESAHEMEGSQEIHSAAPEWKWTSLLLMILWFP